MPTKSKYLAYSPQEQLDRIKRAARALQDGIDAKALQMRGFTKTELKLASKMVGKK